MTSDVDAPRSRRALLAAAAGVAGAVAANAALPLAVAAHDPDDLQLAATNSAPGSTILNCTALDTDAFVVHAANANTGAGIVTVGAHAPGLKSYSGEQAAVFAINGDDSGAATPPGTITTGVYGYAPTAPDPNVSLGTGVWGDSPDTGVYGSGSIGVEGYGGWGVAGFANGTTGSIGVYAQADLPDRALYVDGKAHFSRSGRATVGAGRSSIKVTLAGTSSASRVFAVLHSNRAGRYVRAVVPTTGSFTIYLNTTVTSATYIAWFVLD
jgi:hypothetical protein